MKVPDEVHIAASGRVLQQLRELEPAERQVIVDGLYSGHLAANAKRLARSGREVYTCTMDGYVFEFRQLTPDELEQAKADSGYYVEHMKVISSRMLRRLMG